jgi:thioredoxin 1
MPRPAPLTSPVVAALVLSLAGVTALAETPPAPPAAETRAKVRALTPPELDAALAAGTWLIVEFGGEYCIPCARMQPILQDLQVALGARVQVRNFWIQEHPEVAARFKVMVMPTQIVFDPTGKEVFRHMGYFPPEEFEQVLHEKGLM